MIGAHMLSSRSAGAPTTGRCLAAVFVLVSTLILIVLTESLPGPHAAQRPNASDPPTTVPAAAAAIEQTSQGGRPSAALVESFDGLGFGFTGPHGTSTGRSPSDNSLAVGPDHIVQTVNSQIAVFTKQGSLHETTGKVLYGPIATNTMFAGFGGVCEARPNGDVVVRYDHLAERWLVVMPIFRRAVIRDPDQIVNLAQPAPPGEPARPGQAARPGKPAPPGPPPPLPAQAPARAQPGQSAAPPSAETHGSYAMCYAISAGPDPLGPYYRYAFERPLFPDYPRPAIWPDGYYIPSSTGDDVIQKHACVADRMKMLQGEPATEQCIVIDGVNFLNNADIDGHALPPAGAPNIMMATGGAQLKNDLDDDGIYVWKFQVDWNTPSKTELAGPAKIEVAPYQYLCGGQLTNCVPQTGTDRRLDAQGDKIMPRLVYRRIGDRESVVAVHSVNTAAGGGGVRWYEFRLDAKRDPQLYQQGTYAPDSLYRWMASPAIDRRGNIGIGYSFGGTPHFVGQRFAARLADDPKGTLGLRERVLAEGEASQTNTIRWQDYSQTAMDPTDDCTIWYVGDYIKKDATSYSTRIGAFRMPGCVGR
ncbi:MAG: hypothetical protein LC804_18065 [Acidobacteria bacterium]|nr:hypothetical protein [Acidobacteriota bacterium]